jgi:hypothetical protein
MHTILRTHLLSLIFVGIIFYSIHLLFPPIGEEEKYKNYQLIQEYTSLDFLDLSSPEDRILLREALEIYDPVNSAGHDSLLAEIETYLHDRMLSAAGSKRISSGIGLDKFFDLLKMWINFALIYLFVLLVTYYCVETLAIYRFIRDHYRKPYNQHISGIIKKLIKAKSLKIWTDNALKLLYVTARNLLKGFIILLLFAPAYVIAYSFKTRFDTDSILVMIILGVISNGLLITYMQKYYTFLFAESRKGYVRTAIVKNLDAAMVFNKEKGISLSAIFKINKKFPGHIFDQIYENVKYQYLNTLKEQASFLITGLIIIEMALNIQGHLCYELMQNILYKNLSVILLILFGIFFLVKLTQILIDLIGLKQQKRIGNISAGETE